MPTAEARIGRMLGQVDVQLNGSEPWDPQVKDTDMFERILRGGTKAAGETYMEGMWDCDRIDVLAERLTGGASPISHLGAWAIIKTSVPAWVQNRQTPERARRNASHHYDIGNELYVAMLGATRAYSCAYYEGDESKTLDQAQTDKFDLICRKLKLEPGQRLLDIGCGWGGLLSHAVEEYGVEAVGITPASEQVEYIREHDLPFEVREQDWRELRGTFDRVVSVGMFEHVGQKNYQAYFEKVRELLIPGGLSLLHTIGASKKRNFVDPFINTYIFPGGRIPARSEIEGACEGLFEMADFHNIGRDYDPTLMAWNANFQEAWPELSELTKADGSARYDDKFKRMWEYYLLTCAGSFRSEKNLLFQYVMGDEKAVAGYERER